MSLTAVRRRDRRSHVPGEAGALSAVLYWQSLLK